MWCCGYGGCRCDVVGCDVVVLVLVVVVVVVAVALVVVLILVLVVALVLCFSLFKCVFSSCCRVSAYSVVFRIPSYIFGSSFQCLRKLPVHKPGETDQIS